MFRKITYIVFGAHLLLVVFLLFSPLKKGPQKTKHLVVRTTRQPASVAARSAAPRQKQGQQQENRASSRKAPAATQKKPAAKKTEPAKTVTHAKPAPKKSNKPTVNDPSKNSKPKPAIPQEVLEELEELTTKIDSKAEKSYPSSRLDVPTPIGKSGFDFVGAFESSGYQDSLISYLHQSLHLPDYGEVKIELTLREDGSVAKMAVLMAESRKNKDYLEKNIPSLRFPRLTSKSKEETFILTFCNEI